MTGDEGVRSLLLGDTASLGGGNTVLGGAPEAGDVGWLLDFGDATSFGGGGPDLFSDSCLGFNDRVTPPFEPVEPCRCGEGGDAATSENGLLRCDFPLSCICGIWASGSCSSSTSAPDFALRISGPVLGNSPLAQSLSRWIKVTFGNDLCRMCSLSFGFFGLLWKESW